MQDFYFLRVFEKWRIQENCKNKFKTKLQMKNAAQLDFLFWTYIGFVFDFSRGRPPRQGLPRLKSKRNRSCKAFPFNSSRGRPPREAPHDGAASRRKFRLNSNGCEKGPLHIKSQYIEGPSFNDFRPEQKISMPAKHLQRPPSWMWLKSPCRHAKFLLGPKIVENRTL